MSNPGPNTTSTTTITQDNVGPDGHTLGASSTALISFYGAAPVAQPTSAGQTHAPTAGATTSVFVNTAFDGGITGKNYTVGDIVLALKTLGLIQS